MKLRGQIQGVRLVRGMMKHGFEKSPDPCHVCEQKPVLQRGDEWVCLRCRSYQMNPGSYDALVAPYERSAT